MWDGDDLSAPQLSVSRKIMKIILTLLARDEIDIIQSNIDYHLSNGVDFIIATDNGSVDGTTPILKKYENAGRLEYIYQPPSDFSQGVWVTHMARRAHNHYGADWVINCDSDEFFVPTGTSLQESIKNALKRVPKHIDIISIRRHDFIPFERNYGNRPPKEMIYRKRYSKNLKGQLLLPKVIHRGVKDITVTQGNHNASSQYLQDLTISFPRIDVYHYPIRSFQQFKSKVKNGGSGYSMNKYLPKGTGFHKRHWYELLLEGRLEGEFRRHFFNSQRLSEALSSGEVIKDHTLSRHFKELSTY